MEKVRIETRVVKVICCPYCRKEITLDTEEQKIRKFNEPNIGGYARHHSRWTPEEDTKLCSLRNSGLSWKKVKKQMGRTLPSLYNRYNQINAKVSYETKEPMKHHKLWSEADKLALKDYVARDFSAKEIGLRLGRSPITIAWAKSVFK